MNDAEPAAAPDALAVAIRNETDDLLRNAAAVRRAAEGDDLGTLDRAAALVELAAVNAQLDDLLDRLGGVQGLLATEAGE